MTELLKAIETLEAEHQNALEWYADHKGQTVPWKEIQAHAETGARLVNGAKGIYKPAHTKYALSVRTLPEGPYPDKEVEFRADGSWVTQYYQENPDPSRRDKEATNRGLMHCLEDGVPVGFLVKRKPKPGVEYEVLGLGLVRGWERGYFTIEGYSDAGTSRTDDRVFDAAYSRAVFGSQEEVDQENFDARTDIDLRERTIALVAKRRGQAKFRSKLLVAYSGRCCISGCDFTEALEAAHISPYRGDYSNHTQNGLLLRSDLHALFDLGHLAISNDYTVILSSSARASGSYAQLHGSPLLTPDREADRGSVAALQRHREWAGLS